MFTFLLVIHALIAAALVAVILMQRSEGGGLGMGGSPTGLMSARGAADFLTRATTILATLFVLMSIGLAVLASMRGGPRQIDTSLARQAGAAAGALAPVAPAPANPTGVPLAGDPLAGVAAPPGNNVAPVAPSLPAAPAVSPANSAASGRPARSSKQRAASSTDTAASAPSRNESAPASPAPAATPPANSSPGTTNANSSGAAGL